MSKPIFKIQALSVYISTTLVLLLLGIMGIIYIGGKSLSGQIKENFSITAVMDKESNEQQILKLKKRIEAKESVLECRYISKEQALDEARAALKSDPMELLGENPYRAELEITLKQEFSNSESMEQMEKMLMNNNGVADVIYHKQHIDNVNNNLHKAAVLLSALLVMLTIISWSLIGNLVRLSIYSKRFLLHTMKLVGAKWSFIRRPFILNNLWIGLLSGIIANAILGSAVYLIMQREPNIAALLPVEGLATVGTAITLFGIAICTLCAFFSVNRFLRMRNNDLYFI